MIQLLLDMGLPRRAASDLRTQGWNVEHVGEVGLARAEDMAILEKAAKEGRVVVTLDSDFARIVAVGGLARPSLIHLRLPRVTRSLAVRILIEVVSKTHDDLSAGSIVSVTRGGVRIRRLPVR